MPNPAEGAQGCVTTALSQGSAEVSFISFVPYCSVWLAMEEEIGDRLLLGGWMKELFKIYQISPDLNQ